MIRRAPDSEIDRIFATTRASRSCGRSAGSAQLSSAPSRSPSTCGPPAWGRSLPLTIAPLAGPRQRCAANEEPVRVGNPPHQGTTTTSTTGGLDLPGQQGLAAPDEVLSEYAIDEPAVLAWVAEHGLLGLLHHRLEAAHSYDRGVLSSFVSWFARSLAPRRERGGRREPGRTSLDGARPGRAERIVRHRTTARGARRGGEAVRQGMGGLLPYADQGGPGPRAGHARGRHGVAALRRVDRRLHRRGGLVADPPDLAARAEAARLRRQQRAALPSPSHGGSR